MTVRAGDLFERPTHRGRWGVTPPFVIVDVETTGFSDEDRIVEIAILTMDLDGRVLDEYSTLVNPRGPMRATHVHGITEADVRRAPSFQAIADAVARRLEVGVVVAHNLIFEERMLTNEFRRAGMRPRQCRGLDTQPLARQVLGVGKLSEAAAELGFRIDDHHQAMGDVLAVASMLPGLLGSTSTLKWNVAPQPFREVQAGLVLPRNAPVGRHVPHFGKINRIGSVHVPSSRTSPEARRNRIQAPAPCCPECFVVLPATRECSICGQIR